MDPTIEETLASISGTLLDLLQMLGRVEERLSHLEALAGPHPAVVFDFTKGEVSEYDEDTQSVMHRVWDPAKGKWVYLPPETE